MGDLILSWGVFSCGDPIIGTAPRRKAAGVLAGGEDEGSSVGLPHPHATLALAMFRRRLVFHFWCGMWSVDAT